MDIYFVFECPSEGSRAKEPGPKECRGKEKYKGKHSHGRTWAFPGLPGRSLSAIPFQRWDLHLLLLFLPMAIEWQLLLLCHVTPGFHHCDMKLEQKEDYQVPEFPFSPLLVMPSNAKDTQPALPSIHCQSSTGSPVQPTEGFTDISPKSHDLDLQGRRSSFAECERQFSLKVKNQKRAMLFSFGACSRLSWGRRVGFFAKGASLMTFG